MSSSYKEQLPPAQREVLDQGLRIMARMIAQAYLRDVRAADDSSTTHPTNTPGAADAALPDSTGATAPPDTSD